MENFDKILELKTQIITYIQIETVLMQKRLELEKKCEELQKEYGK